ncbi:succinate dehydrogenase, hydrophobic membrane anchor protein [Terricaulis silvestris]|uniref:Succinate dehydrogenase hydrophobic membrane anchor subunit n=1 Tax=Terricaulis silvestris TaxID=2686094 RepID=A0A6I6MLA6_9CAUL|nr:succinate dehydrogenase, hydrophobic membrane anchor protein [Terricaulis silvestris]QGZ93447.1 succinate dehydrogenase cytochrome b556 small membrane subunit [Terricaulis silvestris]
MSNAKNSMRTPLGRVRHHGAAREGTGHFIALRATSIALAILAPWFVVGAALSIRDASYTATIDFISNPVNAVGIILLVALGLYHMSLGMQEVILDYIHKPFTKVALIFLNVAVPLVLGVGAIFAVLLVNFGV